MRPEIVIADDVTGAGDSGVHFAAAGRRVALLPRVPGSGLPAGIFARHDMAALSTESRFLPPAQAAETVRKIAQLCRAAGAEILYKKIDSTLRGNPGAEIAALLGDSGNNFQTALVCPAMPKTGRTVKNGKLLLHGVPVNETAQGRDPFTPVPSADIAEILAAQTGLPITRLSVEQIRAEDLPPVKGILVADAETDDDLAALAAALDAARRDAAFPKILPAGAGGFAEALAGPPRPDSAAPESAAPEPAGRFLAVVGSLTETSREQTGYAAAHGGFRILDVDIAAGIADPEREAARLAALAAEEEDGGEGGGGRPLLLRNRMPPGGRVDAAAGRRAAEVFAAAARAVCAAARCDILYATGGSTAVAALKELDAPFVTLEREILPGAVLASIPPEAGTETEAEARRFPRRFVSKAGGFGGPDALARIKDFFHDKHENK